MEFYKDLSPKLCVLHSDTMHRDPDGKPDYVSFHCNFHGEYARADLSLKNVAEDTPCITGEGPSDLWDSFEDQLEGDHWQSMRELFALHVENEEAGL